MDVKFLDGSVFKKTESEPNFGFPRMPTGIYCDQITSHLMPAVCMLCFYFQCNGELYSFSVKSWKM